MNLMPKNTRGKIQSIGAQPATNWVITIEAARVQLLTQRLRRER